MNNATPEQLAATVAEWDRRHREEPERFKHEGVRALDPEGNLTSAVIGNSPATVKRIPNAVG